MLLGVLLCYAIGTFWFVLLTLPMAQGTSWRSAFFVCVLPYLPFDFVKVAVAILLTKKLRKFVKI